MKPPAIKSLLIPSPSPKPSPSSPLRIADILLAAPSDDEAAEELGVGAMSGFWRQPQQQNGDAAAAAGACGFECASPRRIVARILRKVKDRRRPLCLRDEKEKVAVEDRTPSMCSSALNARAGSIPKTDESGPFRIDTRFNMGVACSLMYLIASSKNEISKMKELRTDMEMILQNVKDEFGKKDFVIETSIRSEESPAASCFTDLKEDSRCGSILSGSSVAARDVLPGVETITISSRSMLCDDSRKASVDGMELLEAELEAELERLQFRLETESSTESKKITASDITARGSDTFSLGEVVDPDEALPGGNHCGVPPIELERRLHELLETRQQERIKELEAAIECLKVKLSEKEREASWWKDTALLMTRNVSEPSTCSYTDKDYPPGKM